MAKKPGDYVQRGERVGEGRPRMPQGLRIEREAALRAKATWCSDNDCERPGCHRCFPRTGCLEHIKCRMTKPANAVGALVLREPAKVSPEDARLALRRLWDELGDLTEDIDYDALKDEDATNRIKYKLEEAQVLIDGVVGDLPLPTKRRKG